MAAIKDLEVTVLVDDEPVPILPETGYLVIREGTDFFVPDASISFRDHVGSFVTLYPFLQDTRVDISIDTGELKKKVPFFAFSDQKNQIQESALSTYHFQLDLISRYADPLMTEGEFHSKSCKASEYVQYIAEKLNLGADIEESKEIRPWINPGWKYAQMLRFLATRSISVDGSSGYLYFINSDGELVFRTINSMFSQETREDLLIVLDHDAEDSSVVNRDFSMKANYFSSIVLGSNNVKSRFHDRLKGQVVEQNVGYDKNLQKRGIRRGVSQEFAEKGLTKNFGSWMSDQFERPSVLNTAVFKKVMLQAEMFQIEIMVTVDMERKVGDIVNVLIPVREEFDVGEVDVNYSGRYMIKNIVTMGHLDFYQKLTLTRPGINLDEGREGYY